MGQLQNTILILPEKYHYIIIHYQDPGNDKGDEDNDNSENFGQSHIVIVGVDGVQHPHLTFPPGDNVFTFLGNPQNHFLSWF